MSLTAQLSESFRVGFTRIIGSRDPSGLVGFGVCSDGDASSLYLAVHSRAALDEGISAAPEYASDYLWNPDEWDLPAAQASVEQDQLEAANRVIAALDGGDIEEHRDLVWGSVVGAMVQLAADGFFERSPEAVLVVLVADGGLDSDMCEWNVRLNGEERRPELVEFFGLDARER